ncbi:MAG: T9SS type A sorting domain-containing protein [Flavobacteriales bacterium]|nr:T9SS type A sorting domain-containing protein [Flavobacteriales bacterium]
MGRNLLLPILLTFFVSDLFGQQIDSSGVLADNSITKLESSKLEFSSAPNPFSRQTIISIQLPQSGKVSLKVFDVLGQEVAAIANGFMENGNHRITFYGSELPAGRYYFHLNVGGKVLIRPVLKKN